MENKSISKEKQTIDILIIKNALYLNSLLEQELWRTEQALSSKPNREIIELSKLAAEYSKLILEIPNINTTIKNTMSERH